MPRLTVGLTGGLASGKSTVARMFQTLDVPVIDADVIAREVVAPGEPALMVLREQFGSAVFKSTGELDRKQLRQLVFNDPAERKRLEKILHPRIHQKILDALRSLSAPYSILMIPLLMESERAYPVDRILVVDTPRTLQIKRAAQRDGSDTATLDGMLAAQIDRKTRLALADDIIDNQGDIESLCSQVGQLNRKYLKLAGKTGC